VTEIPTPVWSLLGVVLGFSLGEGSRWIREKVHIRRLKHTIRLELTAVLAQINDKKDILRQAIEALNNGRVLPMMAVRAVTMGYRSYIEELYEHFSDIERNCLHVIYERLRVADEHMESFHEDFQKAVKDGMVENPWDAFVGYLEDLVDSYEVIKKLIDSYLYANPEDVFHIKARGKAGL
jgi:hypothetical protein